MTRQPDTIHLHIDGGRNYGTTKRICEKYGGHLQRILQTCTGPQRSEQGIVYASHTPGIGHEELEYFATINLTSYKKGEMIICDIFPTIPGGTVIELERIVLAGNGTKWERSELENSSPLRYVAQSQAPTLPIEIHHGINTETAQLMLPDLLNASNELGLNVGGWFLFEKDKRSFRSNEFTTPDRFETLVIAQNQALNAYLKSTGTTYELWSMAEQVIGLWKI